MLKKVFVFLAGLILVSGIALAVLHQSSSETKWQIDTTSPGGNYSIQLKGENEPHAQPYYKHGKHKVSFDAFKNKESVVINAPLYNGDEYDDLFLDLYPYHEWTSEFVLRLGGKEKASDTQYDEIQISNDTDERIDYLQVNFVNSEIFILLDLPSRQKVQLRALPQTDKQSDNSGIICRMRKGDKDIEGAAGFDIRNKYKSPAHYLVIIGDSGITGPKQDSV
jgi:hypothetical protein